MLVKDARRAHRQGAYEFLLIILLTVLVSACGDNGGVTGSGKVTYTVSGTISDPQAPASASDVTLQLTNNAGAILAKAYPSSADGEPFIFNVGLNTGDSYAVSVLANPPGETCTPSSNASGTIADTSVSGVVILCTPIQYTLTGSISNLLGTGLIVEDVDSGIGATLGHPDVSFMLYSSAHGLLSGNPYTVEIVQNPSNPSQKCTFGDLANQTTQVTGNVPQGKTDLSITCTTDSYQIGANISGLAGSGLELTETVSGQTIGPLAAGANGIFEFPGSFLSGTQYNVAVTGSPTNLVQSCTVAGPSGVVGAGNITLNVACTTRKFSVGFTVTGWPAGYQEMLVTNNATGESLAINGNESTPVTFPTQLPDGTAYSITMDQPLPEGNPAPANCFVMNQYSQGVIAGANVTASIQCAAVGQYLYVARNDLSSAPGAILSFTIDPLSGALTPLQAGASAVPTGNVPSPLSIDLNLNPSTPNTKFAFLANRAANTVSGYSIDTTTGLLTPVGTPALTGTAPWQIAVAYDPTGSHAYVSFYGDVTHEVEGGISAFTVDPTTGALGNRVDYLTGLNAWQNLDFTPDGRYAYQVVIPTKSTAEIAEFSLNSGALVPVPNSSPLSAPYAHALTVDPLGRFAYLLLLQAAAAPPSILAYAINAGTGALTALPPAVTDAGIEGPGNTYISITVDPSGTYAFINESASNSISVFAIDPNSGTLTRAPGTPFRLPEAEGPDSVKIDPSGRFAYVLNGVSNSISAFSINLQKQLGVNALTLIGVYPTNGLSPANLVTIDPSGLFLYASNRNSCNISGFAIDQNTGALTPISGSPFPTAFDVAGTCTVTQGVGDGPGTSTIF